MAVLERQSDCREGKSDESGTLNFAVFTVDFGRSKVRVQRIWERNCLVRPDWWDDGAAQIGRET